ncbi:hypothetical protein [Rhodophyticola sp.]|uniref:hypothetical protein n=1 Tax=Rhodophyticola sp. TaxID=2680032 RepID=UPI003D2890A0
MKRFLITTSAVAILLTGVGSVVVLVANAPAFNAELRRENVFDQTILAVGADMYDRASYLMQQAVSYTRADLLPYGEDPDRLTAPADVVAERGAQAVALMRESLELNPGNAHGWAVMAMARIHAGDITGARDALRASWQLAPNNFSLAPERLDLVLVLFDPLTDDVADILTDKDRAAIGRDLETVARHHRDGDLDYYTEQFKMSGLDVPEPGS